MHSGNNPKRLAAFLGLAFSLSSIASAQQFQAPALPSPPPAAIAQEILQAKMAHAEALKAQMIRAQHEQGASDEFAKKAYKAQQAYLAEQAFLEYNAFLKKEISSQQVASDQVANFTPVKQLPKQIQNAQPVQYSAASVATAGMQPTMQPAMQTASQPKTFMPPVHIAPRVNPELVNFGDEAKPQVESAEQVADQTLQHVGYLGSPEPNATQTQQTTYQESLHSVVQPPVPMAYRLPHAAPNSPQYAYAQVPLVRPPAEREYIFQEHQAVGLQDRITNMLSKPRYRDTNTRQAQLAPRAPVYQPNPATTAPMNRFAQTGRKPRQPLYDPQLDRRQASQSNPVRSNSEVRHAFGMQQPMEQTVQGRRQQPIQQATMFVPTQDPFNDRPMKLPQSSSRPELRGPQSNDGQRRSGQPMKQISILSHGSGSSNQLRQEGQEFNIPSEDEPTQPGQGLFGNKSEQDMNKLDQELNRRMEELEVPSGQDERFREQQMVDDLDQEMRRLRGSNPDRGDSIVGEPGRKAKTQIVQKTCDEFRNELLNGSIRDISLDISPPASMNRNQYEAISRSWTDRSGNIIATGTMVDLRRGYVILEGADGRIKIPYSKLSDADWAAVSDYWRLPELCSVGHRGDASRCWIPQTHTWKASSLCHKPLFFENIQLERYGHTHGPITQPIHSVAHFFESLLLVPYHSAITPANECQYALGFYRPGNCAPWLKDPIPISLSGASRQALVTTGLAFIP